MSAPWLHVCIDMQRLFAEPGEWFAPALPGLIPAVRSLALAAPNATVFTRFVTPASADAAHGTWRGYYQRWSSVCLDHMDPAMLDVVTPLKAWATPSRTFDKRTHSAFADGRFAEWLQGSGYASLVLSGVETDVCVLATALDAVDRGFGVVIATDAIGSSSAAAHAATLAHIYPRFDQQIVQRNVAQIIAEWPAS